MARYIEYDTASGHIISEITASRPPTVSLGVSLIELDDDAEIELGRYVVKDGKLKKIHETNAEKDEQARLKREYSDKVRMASLCLRITMIKPTASSRNTEG